MTLICDKALALDVDSDSLGALRRALPDWEIAALEGTNVVSLIRGRSLARADLLVLGVLADSAATLGLCRELRSQPGHAHTPLVVLVPPAHESLVSAALAAGAQSCLVLPVHDKEIAGAVVRVHAANRPGRHTLNLDQAQQTNPWQDDGGQG